CAGRRCRERLHEGRAAARPHGAACARKRPAADDGPGARTKIPRQCDAVERRSGRERTDRRALEPRPRRQRGRHHPARRSAPASPTAAAGLIMTDVALNPALLAAAEQIESPARRAMRRLFRRKGAVFGMIVIALFVLMAVLAPLITPYDPTAQSWTAVRKAPS